MEFLVHRVAAIRLAYNRFSDFDWHTVNELFPNELTAASAASRMTQEEPFYLLYSGPDRGGYLCANVAHVAMLLLQTMGVSFPWLTARHWPHDLPDEARWITLCKTYSVNKVGIPLDRLDVSSSRAHVVDGIIF